MAASGPDLCILSCGTWFALKVDGMDGIIDGEWHRMDKRLLEWTGLDWNGWNE